MELLKDRPEFKEVVEDNMFFNQSIIDALEEHLEVDYETKRKEVTDTDIEDVLNKIEYEVTVDENQKLKIEIANKDILIYELLTMFERTCTVETELTGLHDASHAVIKVVSEFVNENYISIREDHKLMVGII